MNTAIDITTQQRKALLALLRRYIPGVAVWAYGSRVKWTARPNSDLDLVAFTTPEQRPLVSELKDALAESELPFLVDLHVWDEVPERFREIIRKEYVVVQEAEENVEKNLAGGALFPVVPSDWEWKPLDEVCRRGGGDIQTGPFGSQLHASDYVPFGVPVIMPQNISQDRVSTNGIARISPQDAERLSRYLLNTGDVVYSRRGDVERRALIIEQESGWLCGTGCLRIRFGEGVVVPQYASYFLSHPASREWVVRHSVGATMPNLNTSILGALPFLLPPFRHQHAIADLLGTLDDKIESNRRTSRALERLARAIFRAWFVDFEPVKVKAAGAPSFPGMPQEAFDSLPKRLVESEMGPVPEGWNVLPLDAAVDVNPSRRLTKGAIAPYLDMAQMPTEGHAPIAWAKREAGSGARFMNGDTLVARITPCLENGKTAFVDFLQEGQVGWGSTEYIVLRPKPPIPDLYAYLLARTPEFRAFAIQKMTGSSGRQRVPFDTMGKFTVAIGPAPVMESFGEAVGQLFARSSFSVRESRSLAAMRDYLLPKVLSGEVRVAGVEGDNR